ncbi:MAG TPA: hypothetical protein PLU30_26505 [Verrucomicrobiae bacterium]|nr:hypothetical protein [Verrucomicrobiae bacterium]
MKRALLMALAATAMAARAQESTNNVVGFSTRELPHAVRYEATMGAGQIAAFRALIKPSVQIPEIASNATLRIWVRPETNGSSAVIVEIAR